MSSVPFQKSSHEAYLRAVQHSNRVRFAKKLLPVLAGFGLLVAIVIMVASRLISNVGLDVAGSTISDGKLVMANPKLDGFTDDNRAYTITASRAVQDLIGGTEMQLEDFKANIELQGGQTAELRSATGLFKSEDEQLTFDQQAVLQTSDGLTITMARADIDAKAGTVDADGGVVVNSETTQITASAMQVEEGAKTIIFDQNVRFILKDVSANDAAN